MINNNRNASANFTRNSPTVKITDGKKLWNKFYISTSKDRTSTENNCIINFKEKRNVIACRHFVMQLLKNKFGSKLLPEIFKNKEMIEKSFENESSEKMDAKWADYTKNKPSAIISNKNIGKLLIKESEGMEIGEEKSMAFCTVNHALALQIKKKCDENGVYFSVNIYDPNITGSMIHGRFDNINHLEEVTLESIVHSYIKNYPEAQKYYESINIFGEDSIIYFHSGFHYNSSNQQVKYNQFLDPTVSPARLQLWSQTKKYDQLDNSLLRLDRQQFHKLYIDSINVHAQWLYNSICDNKIEPLIVMAKHIKYFTQDEILNILSSKNSLGVPCIFIAMQNGHEKALEALNPLIEKLNHDQIFKLLTAKSEHGVPGIYFAMQNGHEKVLKALNSLIEKLNPDQIFKLLTAKSKDGVPGVYIAMQKGHGKVLKALKPLIEKLHPDQIFELLTAKSKDGVPGVYIAMQNGHGKVLKALNPLIEKLNPDQIFELLTAKSKDGVPGIYMAVQKEHAKVLEALKPLIEKLHPEQIFELLTAKLDNGNEAIQIAEKNSNINVINALIKLHHYW